MKTVEQEIQELKAKLNDVCKAVHKNGCQRHGIDSLVDSAKDAGNYVRQTIDEIKIQERADEMRKGLSDNPLISVSFAFLLGMAISSIFGRGH